MVFVLLHIRENFATFRAPHAGGSDYGHRLDLQQHGIQNLVLVGGKGDGGRSGHGGNDGNVEADANNMEMMICREDVLV